MESNFNNQFTRFNYDFDPFEVFRGFFGGRDPFGDPFRDYDNDDSDEDIFSKQNRMFGNFGGFNNNFNNMNNGNNFFRNAFDNNFNSNINNNNYFGNFGTFNNFSNMSSSSSSSTMTGGNGVRTSTKKTTTIM
jgi:hypothetical protein